MGIDGEWTEDELDACRGDRFGQLFSEPTSGAPGYDDPKGHPGSSGALTGDKASHGLFVEDLANGDLSFSDP